MVARLCRFESCSGHHSRGWLFVMEISIFSKCIKSLIGDHDKVEVPGLGVFFAEKVPSAFLEQLNTITPPSRRMYFEKAEVEHSAGRLIYEYISSELGVTAEQAEVELSWCLGRIRSELDGNRICILPELGQMKATSQHDYFFVPDDNLDICPESFGLSPVCLRQSAEVPQTSDAAAAEAPAEEKRVLPEINLPEDEQGKDIRTLYEERAKAGLLGNRQPAEPAQPKQEQEPEPIRPPEPVPAVTDSEIHTTGPGRTLKRILIISDILLLLATIAIALLILLPDSIVDRILYTPEELQLIYDPRL